MAKKAGRSTKRSPAPIKRAKRTRRVWKRFKEGTWFAVPIGKGTWSVGVIARIGRRGVTFGYFFGPARRRMLTIDDTRHLSSQNAILLAQFGDLGMQQGYWPVLGEAEGWSRQDWPLPAFARIDDPKANDSGGVKVTYSDRLEWISDRKCSLAIAKKLPQDILSGYGSIEIQLAQLLRRSRKPS